MISRFDLAEENNDSKIKYYFPARMQDFAPYLIDNYLNYQYKQLSHLEALYSHNDNDKVYKISRKRRINIECATEEEKKEIFSSDTATNLKFPY